MSYTPPSPLLLPSNRVPNVHPGLKPALAAGVGACASSRGLEPNRARKKTNPGRKEPNFNSFLQLRRMRGMTSVYEQGRSHRSSEGERRFAGGNCTKGRGTHVVSLQGRSSH